MFTDPLCCISLIAKIMEVMVMICQPPEGYTAANEAMVEADSDF
jgi:hypothetical protein